jgi:TonB family protein
MKRSSAHSIILAACALLIGGCTSTLRAHHGSAVSDSTYNREMEAQGWAHYCGTGACDTPPRLIHATAPEYPPAALARQQHGSATVAFTISLSGEIIDVSITKASAPEFGVAASKAVSAWRFEPARKGGQPVALLVAQEFTFQR